MCLKELPPEIGQLKLLVQLFLRGNQLHDLPLEMRALKLLRYLDLGENQFRRLPPFLGDLSQLEVLNFDGMPDLELPSSDILAQGMKAFLTYLREQEQIP